MEIFFLNGMVSNDMNTIGHNTVTIWPKYNHTVAGRSLNFWGLKNVSRLFIVCLGYPNKDRATVPRDHGENFILKSSITLRLLI